MLTRRAAMYSAVAAVLMLATPSFAADDLKLLRQKVDLVAPPFVHAHEQATKQGPKIMEFKLVIEEKKVVIDGQGTTFQAMTFSAARPRTPLPETSEWLPSAFSRRIDAPSGVGSYRMRPSAPIPVCRWQTSRASASSATPGATS